MKLIKSTLLTVLSLLCLSFGAQAQFQLSGTITFGEDQSPVPGYPVWVVNLTDGQADIELLTDDSGAFEAQIDPISDGFPYVVSVQTFDFCTGEALEQEVSFDVDVQTIEEVNFDVCTDFNPPPPPEGCDAYFFGEPSADDALTIQFFDLSYSEVDFVVYAWDFGDGNTSDEQNPVHTYAEEGVYEVTLTIVAGDCESTFTYPVFVGVNDPCDCPDIFDPVCVTLDDGTEYLFGNSCEAECEGFGPDQYAPCDGFDPCFAYFAVNYNSTDDPLTVSFEDLSSSNEGAVTSWAWDFGDGNTSDEQNPTHTYDAPGVYDVTLVITTDDGCTSTITEHICVFADCDCEDIFEPVCVELEDGFIFSFPNACEAECAGFGEDTWVDCGDECVCPGDFDPVCVTLDDGEVLFFINACYAECEGYTADQYEACDGWGGEDCYADFYMFPTDDALTISFEDASFTYEGEITSWAWDFGDGNTSDEQNPTHTYAEPGFYTVTLTITTDNDCTSSWTQENFVFADCECDDIFDPVCVELEDGFIISFPNACEAECVGYGEDTWVDCGDECVCPDVFDPVCVTLDDGEVLFFFNSCYAECEGFTADQFGECDGWGEEDCYADFFMTPAEDDPLTINFEDTSTATEGMITSWAWDFGDGNTSDEQNPTHTYDAEGIYEVTLSIATDEGCESSITWHICIGEGGFYEGPACQAIFYFDQAPDDAQTFNFEDLSFSDEGEITSWAWDFGDGNTSDEQNPSHTYAEDGIYTVTLTITTDAEEVCESSFSMILFTNEAAWYEAECTALFVPFIQEETREVFFLNLSSFDAVSYVWDFGDGNGSEEPLTAHQYEEGGVYEASLTITTANGCESTYSATIDLDEAEFTGNPQYSLVNNTEDILQGESMTVQPNPATTNVQLTFETAQAGDYTIQLMSTNGQVMQRLQGQALEGENQENLDLEQLPAGLYIIQLQQESSTQIKRVIKK